MAITGYAVKKSGGALEPIQYDLRAVGPQDVEIKISHCGICHSDIHLMDNDWGVSQFPMVPGHEVIGTVESIGNAVKGIRVGDTVGVGWQNKSCGECECCRQGEENLCPASEGTCVTAFGGYAEAIVADARFVIPIPEGLDRERVAPLMCGGITVFTPLEAFDVRPTMHVAVVGIGGLGHMGIQFARAMGCEVTAISTSPDKEAEARQLGAHHFVCSKGKGALAAVMGRYDFILSTVCANIDWTPYIMALRPKGKMCFVGVPDAPMQIAAFPLIAGQRSICGSPIGSPAGIRRMLEFVRLHNVLAQTERFDMKNINEAMAHVRGNKARYRVVLQN